MVLRKRLMRAKYSKRGELEVGIQEKKNQNLVFY
jgi:hypothetical protein